MTMDDDRRVDLYLLRHADAGDPEAWLGPDEERPLSAKGQRQAERLGRHLAETRFRIDALLTSPKVRAAETAAIVGDLVGVRPRIEDRLAEGVDADVVRAILADADDPDAVMLVGHDPDFSDLLSTLTRTELRMRKGALARLEVPAGLSDGSGVLRWLLPPDALRRGS
jgi:phosphohistidine phosphatase